MATARKILVNPADAKQRYILYGNGVIEALGGALPVVQSEGSINSWSVGSGAPVAYTSSFEPYVSFQILNWSTPSGYTLDMWGNVWPWGGATVIPGAATPLTGGPEFLFGTNGGVSSPKYGGIIDFMMDPNGGGTGYLLLYNGDVAAVGTGVTAVAHGGVIPDTAARQLIMDWTSKRYWILDNLGRITGYNGANQVAVTDVNGVAATYPGYVWGRGGHYSQGGARLYDFTATARGWEVDAFGRVYRIGAAQDAPGFQFTPSARQWVDMVIIDDGTGANPLRIVTLTAQGKQFEYVVSTAPVGVVIEPSGAVTTQNMPWMGWQYIDREGDAQVAYDARIITSAVYTVGTTNEVQSTNQTGAPTGGSVKLAFQVDAQAPVATTASIAFNATAATVQAALEALPNIGTGGVVCTGGPWGTAPIVITFSGDAMAGWNWPPITLAQNAFTGGAAPTIAITTTTPGVGIDPAVAANVFSESAGSVAAPDATNRVRPTTELANGTTFRAYARVTDSSGKVSGWTYKQFNIAITALNAPTVTPTVLGGLSGTSLAVAAATGAGLPAAARFATQYHDPTGLPDGVVLDGSVGSYLTTPDSPDWTVSGVLRFVMRVKPVSWATGVAQILATHTGVSNFAVQWYIGVTGAQGFQVSADGTAVTSVGSGTMGLVNNTPYWIGVEYNTLTGAYAFYKASDQSTTPALWSGWSLILSSTTAAVTMFESNAIVRLGADSAGGSRLTGTVYDFRWYNNGVLVANPDFTASASPRAVLGATTYTDSTGKVWSLLGTAKIAEAEGTWLNVRNGDALAPINGGAAACTDYEAPFGVQRSYRAVTYVYDSAADAWQQSAWSATQTATLTPRNVWAFTNPFTPSQDILIKQQPEFKLVWPTVSQTFMPSNRDDPIVLSDGKPKLPSFHLDLWALNKATRQAIETLLASNVVLLVRTPWGHVLYCKVTGDFDQQFMLARPLSTELTSVRDANSSGIAMQTVKRPIAGPLTGPLVEV